MCRTIINMTVNNTTTKGNTMSRKWKVRTETFSDNGSVSVYFGDIWLCNEDNKSEAINEARFVLTAADNGAGWVNDEFPGLTKAIQSWDDSHQN